MANDKIFLNPGSPVAVKMGCRCPILDNEYGWGYMKEGMFVCVENCPLHDVKTKVKEKIKYEPPFVSNGVSTILTIRDLQAENYKTACEKGWWDEPRTIGDCIALCHSELSEALEEYRNGEDLKTVRFGENDKPEGFAVELADTIIRIADLAEKHGIDLEAVLKLKMAYNKTRPFRHGGKRL